MFQAFRVPSHRLRLPRKLAAFASRAAQANQTKPERTQPQVAFLKCSLKWTQQGQASDSEDNVYVSPCSHLNPSACPQSVKTWRMSYICVCVWTDKMQHILHFPSPILRHFFGSSRGRATMGRRGAGRC